MGHLDRDLCSADTLMAHLNEIHLRELAASAQALITQLHTDVSEMHLGNLSHNADELLTDVKGTVGRLDSVVANLDTASLNDALGNIRLATRSLDETLRKLKQYPSGFLLGKPPPLASSVEKSKE